MKKKIGYICLLIVIIVAILLFFAVQGKIKIGGKSDTNTQSIVNRSSNEVESENVKVENTKKSTKETIKKELDDGVLYTLSEEDVEPNIVIGDNFYDTQITDIMTNFSIYKGKVIEIEGMFLDSTPYTFVGRYSTSNLCAYCPQGYSYFEYIWDGEKINLVDEQSWIKIKGTLCVGNDNTSNFQDYYYIQASSIEVMNEKGIDTVNN